MIYKLLAAIGIAIIPFIFLGALCVTQEVDRALTVVLAYSVCLLCFVPLLAFLDIYEFGLSPSQK